MNSSKCAILSALFLLVILTHRAGAQGEDISWTRYHNTSETHAILEAWAREFPQLSSLHSIGETIEVTPLLVLEITNKETGDALEKPAYYYDGNIHAGELTSAEVALYFAWYLLSNYGRDTRVTHLIDTRTLYIRPKFNPDGADVALNTIHSPRSTPRPYDEDNDGLLDEDPPNDLDGDGFITQMLVANPKGIWVKNAEDARVIERRSPEELTGEFFDLFSEGVDDDGDGEFNETMWAEST